jgi:hypothetical protein
MVLPIGDIVSHGIVNRWHSVAWYCHFRHAPQNCGRWLLASSCLYLSVRTEQLGSQWTDLHEIWYLTILRNSVQKLKFNYSLTRITGISHEHKCTFFLSYFVLLLLKMRNFQAERLYRKYKKKFMISIFFNRAFYEIMWKNIILPDKP